MTKADAKRAAKKARIPFAIVEGIYRELRVLHRMEREWEWTIRRRAWERMRPPGCHEFWRHGFHVRYRRAFNEGDCEDIPGFDELAADMAREFPELDRDGNAGAVLFELLKRPHNCLPTSEESWDQAIASCAELEPVAATSDVPF